MHSLREILNAPTVSYAMEAHNAISAKIVEEAGFPLIWASGFTLSASLGHRDCNELSWSAVCDQIEYMIAATTIPILVDGDSGFGNFNNVRQLVKKLCKYGAAGVCLEDKLFPKRNSLLEVEQELAPVEEFLSKIHAAKDTQASYDFCVIARTEALIVNHGLEEALSRARVYAEAGADAILVHSKGLTIAEIAHFCELWDDSAPLVIVPTTYGHVSPDLFHKLGISLVIWANHLLRSAIVAMRATAQVMARQCSLESIESQIAPLHDVFDLVDEAELRRAEQKYGLRVCLTP